MQKRKSLTPFDLCQYKAGGGKSGTQKIIQSQLNSVPMKQIYEFFVDFGGFLEFKNLSLLVLREFMLPYIKAKLPC